MLCFALLPRLGAQHDRVGSQYRCDDRCTRWTSYPMRPEPLIQKLFAIERAIGHTSPAALRAMVIDAEETALRLDLDNLHNIESIRRSAEKRQLANLRQFVNPEDDSDFPWSA